MAKAVVFYDEVEAQTQNAPDQSIDEAYVNLGAESQASRVVQNGAQSSAVDSDTLGPLTFDAAAQKYFFIDQQSNGTGNPLIYVGSTTTGTVTPTPIYTALSTAQINNGDSATINDIVDNPLTNTLYFTQEILDGNEHVVSSGIYSIPEAGGTAHAVATGLTNANYLALDLADNLVFFSDSTGTGLESEYGGVNVNKLDVANLSTGAVTILLTEPVTLDGNGNYNGPVLSGVAINPLTHTLYYTTNDIFYDANNAEGDDGIYSVSYTPTGSGTTATASINTATTHTLYAGTNALDPSNILLDVPDNAFYAVAGPQEYIANFQDYIPYDLGVYEGSLSANNTAALTRVTSVAETAGKQPAGANAADGSNQDQFLEGIAVDVAPQETAGSTVTWVSGAPVTADSGFVDSAGTSPTFTSATVVITGAEPGDVLAATTGTGITASYSASTFTLTLTGSGTPAQYQQVIDSLTFNNTSSNPTASGASTSRTLTYAISDGIVAGSATSTINVHAAPVVTPGTPSVTFTGGGSAVAVDPGLTVTDYSSSSLASGTVSITGATFLTGDTLNFTNQNGITGSYNATTGVLALSGVATTAQYQTAIRSVTFGFTPSNGNPTSGGDTSRTLSYTVNDGTSASAAVTSTLTVVHAAPSLTAGAVVAFTRGDGTPIATDPAGTVTAPDSGGTIASATVTITAGFKATDVLAFTQGNGITGSYNTATGVLSLTGTATAAQYQTAIDSVTFTTGNAAAAGPRSISYVVNDGTASSSAVLSTVNVQTPTPSISGTAANQAVSDEATIHPFSAVAITDTAGETDSATIVLSRSGATTDADGALSGTGLTKTATGTYTLAATDPVTLSSELKALVFTPTAHQVAPGSTVTTAFSLALADTGGGTATNTGTSVVATAATDAPSITGTVAGQTTTDLVPINPFATVAIGDVDTGANPTVTIVIKDGGTATDGDGALSGTGLSKTGTGTYQLAAAAPGTLTNEIEALTFTPTPNEVAVGQTVTDIFAITAAFGGMSTTDSTTTVTSTDVPCFCAGTLIRTTLGEVPVEQLAIGDRLVTASGGTRPIVWIGTRRYAGRFLRANPAVQPIRIQAGALEPGVPVRDLHLSPLHALFIDGLLIPAGELVNGHSITRETVDSVSYFHIELDRHDVLLAEGAPAESFLDDGSAGMFHNAATRPARPSPDAFCAPRMVGGYAVEAVRRRLAA